MLTRHEEKYILTYPQYIELISRARQVLSPDDHGENGTYTITSIYYDDPMDTGLYEKLDGLKLHSKFRARTYDYNTGFVRLERKDKLGILTKKISAVVDWELLPQLTTPGSWEQFDGTARELLQQMQSSQQQPVVAVRYERDAFFHEASDFRLTFDRNLEALPPDTEALSNPDFTGIPVLPTGNVVMEVKYGAYLPAFARKLTRVKAQQLSLSKYALCRIRLGK